MSFTKHSKKTLLNHLHLGIGLEREKKNVTHNHNKTLVLGLMPFLHHAYLYELAMSGKFEKLSEQIEFYPPNLLKLELKGPNPSFLFLTRGTLPALLRIRKKKSFISFKHFQKLIRGANPFIQLHFSLKSYETLWDNFFFFFLH